VSFIRAENANVATNQQINYSKKNLENELNTGDIHEMDRRSSGKASRANQEIEASICSSKTHLRMRFNNYQEVKRSDTGL
jgi:hypothetical protein